MRLTPALALLATLSAPLSFAGFFGDELDDYQSATRDRVCCWNELWPQVKADCGKFFSESDMARYKLERSHGLTLSTDLASNLNAAASLVRDCEDEWRRKHCGEPATKEEMVGAECLKAGFPEARCDAAQSAGKAQADLECPKTKP